MRRTAHHGLEIERHPLETFRDTYALALWLEDVWGYHSNEAADSTAVGGGVFDVDEAESYGAWRKVYLARYGRQSMLQWDNVLVTEIQRLLKELIDLIKREGALDQINEDG